MTEGIKKFEVYRLKGGSEHAEALRHRSWNFLQKYHIRVASDSYQLICEQPFMWDLQPMDIRRQLESGLPAASSDEKLEVSDVLAITKDGIRSAYYVDVEKLIVLTDFFPATASTALLSIETTDYQIEGRPGNWLAADETWIDGQHFFLMQSQDYGKKAMYAVLDSNGKPAAQDTTEGFASKEVIRQIREYIARQNVAGKEAERSSSDAPPLENWQKSYENGEYLRSAEMAEEQNYSMIDGRMNNMPSKAPSRQRPARKRRKGKLPPKSRESVLKRLREYQDELATQRGQTAPSQDTPDLQERRKA